MMEMIVISGIDEQPDDRRYKCLECDGTEFYRVDYGARTSSIELDPEVVYPYNDGTFECNDTDDWQCSSCYTRADDVLRELINEIILREETG